MSEIKVPNGYKKTEIGIIPEDWEVFTLEDIANFGGGTTPARDSYDKYYAYGTNPWVKTLDLNNGFLTSTDESVTDTALQEVSLKKHPAGSVLIAMYGGFKQIGRTGLLKMDASINQALVAVIPHKSKLTSEYLLYNLNYNVDYWKNVASSSRKDPNITSNDIKKYALPLPLKPEQTAIANALSDTDNLIQSLEKLIAKKKAIKTGTMQQLLTGKTRLPEFATREDGSAKGFKQTELGKIPEDWQVVKIIDNHTIATGNTPPTNDTKNYGDQFLFVSPSDLGIHKLILNTEKKLSKKGYNLARKFPKGSTLFTCIGSTIGKTGLAICELTSNQQINAVFPNDTDNSEFTYYALTYHSRRVRDKASEQAVPLINKTEFGQFEYMQPNETKEQNAIATILSDMDAEIKALQDRLEKTKAIKQGMMQQLLTGKVRLVQQNLTDSTTTCANSGTAV